MCTTTGLIPFISSGCLMMYPAEEKEGQKKGFTDVILARERPVMDYPYGEEYLYQTLQQNVVRLVAVSIMGATFSSGFTCL